MHDCWSDFTHMQHWYFWGYILFKNSKFILQRHDMCCFIGSVLVRWYWRWGWSCKGRGFRIGRAYQGWRRCRWIANGMCLQYADGVASSSSDIPPASSLKWAGNRRCTVGQFGELSDKGTIQICGDPWLYATICIQKHTQCLWIVQQMVKIS